MFSFNSKSTNSIKKFNNVMEQFLEQLVPFTGQKHLIYFKKLLKIDSTLAIKKYIEQCLIHKEKIMNKDEKYFSNKDIKNELSQNTESKSLDEIIDLERIYFELNDESKAAVWTFMQALLVVSEEYIASKK